MVEEEEDQGAAIDSDNSSELSEILSFEIDGMDGMDGMDIDSIGNGEGSSDEVLKTRSGRVFGI